MARKQKYKIRMSSRKSHILGHHWWWTIVALNGQIIQTSETYKSFRGAWKSATAFSNRHLMLSVIAGRNVNPKRTHLVELPNLVAVPEDARADIIEIFKDVADLWRWRIRAPNWAILTSGEACVDERGVWRTLDRFVAELTNFTVIDKVHVKRWSA